MKKTICFLLAFTMVFSACNLCVFGASQAAYWGQSFTAEEDYEALPCTAMFYHEAGVTNYEFKLFKDGVEVYTNRIEEGLSEDFSTWEEEYLFLDKFSQYGSGSYHFSVSSLTGTGAEIDEAQVIETVTSDAFAYVQPAEALPAPEIIQAGPSTATWHAMDQNTHGYLYDLEVHYGDGVVYDPDYTERYTEETSFSVKEIEDVLDFLEKYNAEKYPKKDAEVKIRVRALPADVRTVRPSPYTAWMTLKVMTAVGGGGGSSQVDRTLVSNAYYDAAKVVFDLGLLSEVYEKHDQKVTKGAIAPVLVAMMGQEKTAEAMVDMVRFTDTTAGDYLNGCVNYLANKGIINGQGDGTYGVDAELLYPQVVKILVSVCGYDPMATQYGGYPSGYLAAASRCGILDGLQGISTESAVTYEVLSQLVFNALHAKLMVVDSYSMSGTTYKITDDTLLYQLGYVRYAGEVKIEEDNTATVTGKLYNEENPKGLEGTQKGLAIADGEMHSYLNSRMTLYVKGTDIVSALEVYEASAIVNEGEYTTYSRMVPIALSAYGYTKYKIGNGEYAPLTEEVIYYLPDSKTGYYTISITFANEAETRSETLNRGVSLKNTHKVTYMVNGKVHTQKEVDTGAAIPTPYAPYVENYSFGGWLAVPEVMPDKDITIHAQMTPQVTVTGALTYQGEPLKEAASIYVNGRYITCTDAEGKYSLTCLVGEMAMSVVAANLGVNETFMIDVQEDTTDLGTQNLSSASVRVNSMPNGVLKADGLSALLYETDYAYAQTESNGVRVEMEAVTLSENAPVSTYMEEHYPEYALVNLQDITLKKIRTGAERTTEEITTTQDFVYVTLAIPAEKQGKEDYRVLREHDGAVDVIVKEPNQDGECIVAVEGDRITVKVKKFSAYGVIGAGVAPDATGYIMNVNRTALNSVTVDVIVPKTPKADAVLFVAFYDGEGQLIALETRTEMAASETFTIEQMAMEVKAFIWDGNLKPLHM